MVRGASILFLILNISHGVADVKGVMPAGEIYFEGGLRSISKRIRRSGYYQQFACYVNDLYDFP